jgi:hypothetical protein
VNIPEYVGENYEVISDSMDALVAQLEGWKKHWPPKYELFMRLFEKSTIEELRFYPAFADYLDELDRRKR